ncbi:MAG: alpha/beta fold hydrolase [Gammaproteobacteria bacterium]|nr:alpha/beta fold hydrolase [Gammaproteobacteria bacterium]
MISQFVNGPSGKLEVLVEAPAQALENLKSQSSAKTGAVAVICHPHPLHGGSMNNKVVHTIARAFTDEGQAAIRFNFRGVGQSVGEYDNGIGESDDARAVLRWTEQQYPNDVIWLCGFSFGAAVALHVASEQTTLAGVIAVAPPIDYVELSAAMACPYLVVHGEEDELIKFDEVKQWSQALIPTPEFVAIKNAGHFFHGELSALKNVLRNFIVGSDSVE